MRQLLHFVYSDNNIIPFFLVKGSYANLKIFSDMLETMLLDGNVSTYSVAG